jgi:hypothetical protein
MTSRFRSYAFSASCVRPSPICCNVSPRVCRSTTDIICIRVDVSPVISIFRSSVFRLLRFQIMRSAGGRATTTLIIAIMASVDIAISRLACTATVQEIVFPLVENEWALYIGFTAVVAGIVEYISLRPRWHTELLYWARVIWKSRLMILTRF